MSTYFKVHYYTKTTTDGAFGEKSVGQMHIQVGHVSEDESMEWERTWVITDAREQITWDRLRVPGELREVIERGLGIKDGQR